MKKNFVVDCDIKERQGMHYVKIDVFKGSLDDCVSFLITKYNARIPGRLERVFDLMGQASNHGKQKKK